MMALSAEAIEAEIRRAELMGLVVPLVILAAVVGIIALLAVRRALLFKVAFRSVLRSPLQSALIIFGMSLAAAVLTVAGALGDSAIAGALGDSALSDEEAVAIALVAALLVSLALTFLGSYNILAGLLFIVMVFTLLAAARQREMGVARAIGMTRSDLSSVYLFEGVIYAGAASVVGIVLGLILTAVLLAVGRGILPPGSEWAEFLVFRVSAGSILWTLALSGALTVATVALATARAGRLNIVVAIRGLPADFVTPTIVGSGLSGQWALLLGGPALTLATRGRNRRSPLLAVAVLLVMVITAAVLLSVWNVWGALLVLILEWMAYGYEPLARVAGSAGRSGLPFLVPGAWICAAQLDLRDDLDLVPDWLYSWLFMNMSPFFLLLGALLVLLGAFLLIAWLITKALPQHRRLVNSAMALAGVIAGTLIVTLPLEWLLTDSGVGGWAIVLASLVSVLLPVAGVAMASPVLMFVFNRVLGHVPRATISLRLAVAYLFPARFKLGIAMATFSLALFGVTLVTMLVSGAAAEFMGDERANFNAAFAIGFGFVSMGLIVIVAGLALISYKAVLDRRRSIAILRAIGLQRPSLVLQYVLETSMVAIFSVAIGVPMGILHGSRLRGEGAVDLSLEFPWVQIGLLAGGVVLVALLVTLLSAIKASRITPADVLGADE